MITRSDALNNQKRAKNSSKMIQFPSDISPCNIPSVSLAIWVAEILRYTISRCISVWVPIVLYVPYCKAIFFCNIAYCMLHWCKIPLIFLHFGICLISILLLVFVLHPMVVPVGSNGVSPCGALNNPFCRFIIEPYCSIKSSQNILSS